MQFRHRRTRAAGLTAALLGTAALSLTLTGQAEAKTFPHGIVKADGGLVAHQAPSTHAPLTYTFQDGAEVAVDCATKGTRVSGNPDWYLISAEGDAKWVSARYVDLEAEPRHCGPDLSVAATTTKSTGAYEGPSTADRRRTTLAKGTTTEILCYTDSGPTAKTTRWLLTTEAQWIPSTALKTSGEVEFCQQG
ncbi:hypothetical protein SLNWT_5188 [Streptomyces albus]|uniref:SH3 domain-containing protein n=1 Tax=Streptomyces albus (strain ATCC 21838 / DSM 41398 / FERM P-419 / JCM 4703 / NBRC 107858) TaxID=1081613 RepID=A0A0B5EUW0_STRA4|nr:hypothetical protein SLNWT_5188 [Streptomyces albus]AOU79868.1 hypothetical protein SLNHY_5177 [Streptomyces albus]AYN35591.1 hypothetical protein DUI70_5093 [Streptomyces albus]